MKNIKITPQQYNQILESASEFIYFGDSSVNHSDSNTAISADGKMNSDENADPLTTDKFATSLMPQNAYWRRFIRAGRVQGVREALSPDKDKNGDGLDDFYDDNDMDTLSNGDKDDNLVRIPYAVESKVNMMLDALHSATLTPKQQCIVLNRIVESMNLKGLPYSWVKGIFKKIKL